MYDDFISDLLSGQLKGVLLKFYDECSQVVFYLYVDHSISYFRYNLFINL